jgi:ceramide glucosyltransferase
VAACAQKTGDVPFIMGQLMVLRREAIAAIGGLACADGQLVDDMHIGARITEAGMRNIQSSHPLCIATGGMTLADFARLYRRWLMFSRAGLPRSFTWPLWQRGLEFWLGLLAVLLAMVTRHAAAALLPGAALAMYAASVAGLQRAFGGEPIAARYFWLPLSIFVISPLVMLTTLMRREVSWRGRAYALDAEARLA